MTANSATPSQREFDPSNPLSSFVDVIRRIVLHPVVFFAGIPRRGGLSSPFIFALDSDKERVDSAGHPYRFVGALRRRG